MGYESGAEFGNAGLRRRIWTRMHAYGGGRGHNARITCGPPLPALTQQAQLQVATKVNNVHPGEVALTDVVVVGSWLHGHSNHAISGWSFAQKTLVLKHVEVPTGCCGPCRWVADPIFTSRCTGRGLSLRLALPHCATTGMPTTSCWQQICTPASVGLLSKPGYT